MQEFDESNKISFFLVYYMAELDSPVSGFRSNLKIGDNDDEHLSYYNKQ